DAHLREMRPREPHLRRGRRGAHVEGLRHRAPRPVAARRLDPRAGGLGQADAGGRPGRQDFRDLQADRAALRGAHRRIAEGHDFQVPEHRGAKHMITRLIAILIAATAAGAPAVAFAQAFPSKQVQVVLSFPPGSATDLATRIVAEKLRERLGQPVVVENRSGAGAVLGETYIAKAPADGHFIGIGSSTSLTVAPNTRLRLEYDVRRDFIPLSLLCEVPQWIVANPALPAATLGELAALVKWQPGKFSYASYGQGTLSHLGMELWKSM